MDGQHDHLAETGEKRDDTLHCEEPIVASDRALKNACSGNASSPFTENNAEAHGLPAVTKEESAKLNDGPPARSVEVDLRMSQVTDKASAVNYDVEIPSKVDTTSIVRKTRETSSRRDISGEVVYTDKEDVTGNPQKSPMLQRHSFGGESPEFSKTSANKPRRSSQGETVPGIRILSNLSVLAVKVTPAPDKSPTASDGEENSVSNQRQMSRRSSVASEISLSSDGSFVSQTSIGRNSIAPDNTSEDLPIALSSSKKSKTVKKILSIGIDSFLSMMISFALSSITLLPIILFSLYLPNPVDESYCIFQCGSNFLDDKFCTIFYCSRGKFLCDIFVSGPVSFMAIVYQFKETFPDEFLRRKREILVTSLTLLIISSLAYSLEVFFFHKRLFLGQFCWLASLFSTFFNYFKEENDKSQPNKRDGHSGKSSETSKKKSYRKRLKWLKVALVRVYAFIVPSVVATFGVMVYLPMLQLYSGASYITMYVNPLIFFCLSYSVKKSLRFLLLVGMKNQSPKTVSGRLKLAADKSLSKQGGLTARSLHDARVDDRDRKYIRVDPTLILMYSTFQLLQLAASLNSTNRDELLLILISSVSSTSTYIFTLLLSAYHRAKKKEMAAARRKKSRLDDVSRETIGSRRLTLKQLALAVIPFFSDTEANVIPGPPPPPVSGQKDTDTPQDIGARIDLLDPNYPAQSDAEDELDPPPDAPFLHLPDWLSAVVSMKKLHLDLDMMWKRVALNLTLGCLAGVGSILSILLSRKLLSQYLYRNCLLQFPMIEESQISLLKFLGIAAIVTIIAWSFLFLLETLGIGILALWVRGRREILLQMSIMTLLYGSYFYSFLLFSIMTETNKKLLSEIAAAKLLGGNMNTPEC